MSVNWRSGVYLGNHVPGGNRKAQVDAFEAARGSVPVGVVEDYSGNVGWDAVEKAGYSGFLTEIKKELDAGRWLSIGVVPWPKYQSDGSTLMTGVSWATIASGAQDAHYQALGTNLAAAGLNDARVIIRLAVEFNGSFFYYYAGNDTTSFKAAWKRIRDLVHQAAPNVKFSLNYNSGYGSGPTPLDYYPGSAYVDVHGLDFYDQSWAPNSYPYTNPDLTSADSLARQDVAWNDILNGAYGLAWHFNFAKQQGRQVAVHEWNIFNRPDGHGGLDDPRFIQRVNDFYQANASTLLFESLFNIDATDGKHYLLPGATTFPQSAAKYTNLWSTSGGIVAPPPTVDPIATVATTRRNHRLLNV